MAIAIKLSAELNLPDLFASVKLVPDIPHGGIQWEKLKAPSTL